MNMNKKIGLSVTLLILLGIVILGVYKRSNDGYSAFVALGCVAEKYNEETDTVLINYPLYCPKCKQESLIEVENLNIAVIKKARR